MSLVLQKSFQVRGGEAGVWMIAMCVFVLIKGIIIVSKYSHNYLQCHAQHMIREGEDMIKVHVHVLISSIVNTLVYFILFFIFRA